MFWLSLSLSLSARSKASTSSSMSGLFCGPSQNVRTTLNVLSRFKRSRIIRMCVCAACFSLQIDIFRKTQMDRIMFFRIRTRLYIFRSVLSFFLSILQPTLAFFCLKIIPWICLCLCFPLFYPTRHCVDILDRAAIPLPISSISSGVLLSRTEMC
jgi:hypothetical protein